MSLPCGSDTAAQTELLVWARTFSSALPPETPVAVLDICGFRVGHSATEEH